MNERVTKEKCKIKIVSGYIYKKRSWYVISVENARNERYYIELNQFFYFFISSTYAAPCSKWDCIREKILKHCFFSFCYTGTTVEGKPK